MLFLDLQSVLALRAAPAALLGRPVAAEGQRLRSLCHSDRPATDRQHLTAALLRFPFPITSCVIQLLEIIELRVLPF